MAISLCCKELEDNLSGVNGQAAGLHLYELTSARTGKKRIAGVYVRKERKRKAADKGVLIRWCPFCRCDLHERFDLRLRRYAKAEG